MVYPQASEQQEVGIKHSTFKLIKRFEGVSKTPYDDGFGNYTIGVGHHIKQVQQLLWLKHLGLMVSQIALRLMELQATRKLHYSNVLSLLIQQT